MLRAISETYKMKTDVELIDDLRDALSGDLETLCVNRLTKPNLNPEFR